MALSGVDTKWKELQLFESCCEAGTDPKIKAYIASLSHFIAQPPTIDDIMACMNMDCDLPWIIPLIECNLEERKIEMQNMGEKLRRHASIGKKAVGEAMYILFEADDCCDDGFKDEDALGIARAPSAANDPTIMYLALCRLLETEDMTLLKEFEHLVECALSNTCPLVAKAAFKVLERTRNDGNADIIDFYRQSIEADANVGDGDDGDDETDHIQEIASITFASFVGDWVPVGAAAEGACNRIHSSKRGIFEGFMQ